MPAAGINPVVDIARSHLGAEIEGAAHGALDAAIPKSWFGWAPLVAAFLDLWLEHMQGQVSPRSHERYAEIARKNLVPLLGGLALTKLRPEQVSQAYATALTSGRRDGSGGLSARTVTHLREALQQAVQWQMLARNPADAVK